MPATTPAKRNPALRKILVVCFVIGVIYVGISRNRPHPSPTPSSYVDNHGGETSDGGTVEGNQQLVQRELEQLLTQQAALRPKIAECMQEEQQFTNQMRDAAISGQMMGGRPACEPYMQQWTGQEAFLETEIYKLQTGDTKATVSQVTGIPINTGSTSSQSRGGAGDGSDPDGRYSRNAIRETSLYRDADGETHELPTRSYYFRDRVSGQFVGSDSSNPPNDGHDYDAMQNVDSPND